MKEITPELAEAVSAAQFDAAHTVPTELHVEPTVPPFPTGSLPAWWKSFVEATAEATQTPLDLAASVTLGVMAAAVSGKSRIQAAPGWVEPLNLYLACALPPGNRKSAVFNLATAPLREVEMDLIEDAKPEVRRQATLKKLREDTAENVRKQVMNGKKTEDQYLAAVQAAEEIPVLTLPRLLADDATPEALTSLAADNGGKISVASAEGGIFDIFAGRYSGGMPNMDILLKGHAGDAMTVDRKGRPSERIESVCLNMNLTVQPAVLRQIGSGSPEKSKGELERFLFTVPKSSVGFRSVDSRPVPAAVKAAYYHHVSALARAGAEPGEPLLIRLDPDATKLFTDWQRVIEADLRPNGLLGDPRVIGWGSKLAGTTARFAGILHLASGKSADELVSADTADCAAAMAEHFAQHALAAFHLMSLSDPHKKAKELRMIIIINKFYSFTERDLLTKASRSVFPDALAIKEALAILLDHEWVFRVEMPDQPGPGRKPSQMYVPHRSIFDQSHTAAVSAQYAESA
ncbi:YfjI family protein [Pseudarthrobacter sp. AB1]|uniref:YfjI family protein n=1 Tax=Pseudarthrobacter sp. AB1 TaxID=2138309 RepID=UPI00186B6F3A|nr:YfjI family protein [Pseudarthrobacter sp. AB1]MBE4716756.1 DNA primase [Pseudarthrobacter sp. AB1]